MLLALLFVMASFGLWLGAFVVYPLAIAVVGRSFGLGIEHIEVGWGPLVFRREFRLCSFRLHAFPIYSGASFRRVDDEGAQENRPAVQEVRGERLYQDAPALVRAMTCIAGPLVTIAIGLTFMAIPIWREAPRLEVCSTSEDEIRPSGVPGLGHSDERATWRSQMMLFRRTTVELLVRLATFRSVDGWGGLIAFLLTAGRVGSVSCMAWHSLMGVMFLSLGMFNLLPVPGLIGFSLACNFVDWIFGRSLPEKQLVFLMIASISLLFALSIRVAWLDLWWIGKSLLG